MKRELPTPKDDPERKSLKDVAESGCHVIKVMEDDSGPGFAYSIVRDDLLTGVALDPEQSGHIPD